MAMVYFDVVWGLLKWPYDIFIGNNLKTSKNWNTQGSWNGTIVSTNKKSQRLYASNATLETISIFLPPKKKGQKCKASHKEEIWKMVYF